MGSRRRGVKCRHLLPVAYYLHTVKLWFRKVGMAVAVWAFLRLLDVVSIKLGGRKK